MSSDACPPGLLLLSPAQPHTRSPPWSPGPALASCAVLAAGRRPPERESSPAGQQRPDSVKGQGRPVVPFPGRAGGSSEAGDLRRLEQPGGLPGGEMPGKPRVGVSPFLGLLAPLAAVWPWTDSWPLHAKQNLEQGVGPHVTSAPQSRRAELQAGLPSAPALSWPPVFTVSSVLPKERLGLFLLTKVRQI